MEKEKRQYPHCRNQAGMETAGARMCVRPCARGQLSQMLGSLTFGTPASNSSLAGSVPTHDIVSRWPNSMNLRTQFLPPSRGLGREEDPLWVSIYCRFPVSAGCSHQRPAWTEASLMPSVTQCLVAPAHSPGSAVQPRVILTSFLLAGPHENPWKYHTERGEDSGTGVRLG